MNCKCACNGVTKTRYQWTQEQRRIETAVRRQKDVSICARAAGNTPLRRDAQRTINALMERYEKVSEAAGINLQYDRMRVKGFKHTSDKELRKTKESDMLITDKQLGKKAGKHMAEWGLKPSSAEDRQRYIDITNEIKNNADEIRRVPWLFDKKTGKRTVEVNAYIRGNDVVLVDDNDMYITTMKNGINNARVRGGK